MFVVPLSGLVPVCSLRFMMGPWWWFQWSFGGGGGVFGGTVEATDVVVAVVSSPLPWRGLAVN
jgi:hypothetical protein